MIARTNATKNDDVIVLEFNELCPQFMQQFIDAGKLPNFQRLRDRSVAMITDADEAPPRLEPWIQWVSIHTGLKADDHGVFDLGEGRKVRHKGVAQILSDAGVPVGVLGSMNTNYRNLNGFYIPDPWDLNGQAEPASLQPFYQTVAKQVQESSTQEGLSKAEMVRFGWFMLMHGMRPSTIQAGVAQVWSELRDKGVEWRRSMILERLQFDLFRKLKRRLKTRFNTFFCNSTAHFQHYFWRNMEPEIFTVPPGENDHPSLRNAIEEGYRAMDRLVGKFMTEFPDSRLVLLTALSQQPWRETTKCTYRPRDFQAFLQFVGIDPSNVEVKPVMAEEFHLICRRPEMRQKIQEKLLAASVNGQPAMKARIEDEGVFSGCAINDFSAKGVKIMHPVGGERLFDEVFHMVHSMRSGRHHPHGLFWVQSNRPRIVPDPIPLVDVAPTLLNLFAVPAPEYMTGHVVDVDLAPATPQMATA